jgi:hypothetical protein
VWSVLNRPDSLNCLLINLMDQIETVIYDEVICDDCFVPPCSKTRNYARIFKGLWDRWEGPR